MYCPRCNKEMVGEMFCESCGCETINTPGEIDEQSKRIINIDDEINEGRDRDPKLKLKLIRTILIIVLIGVGFVSFKYIKSQNTPILAVERYYGLLGENEYEKAYSLLDETNNEFLNKELFIKFYENKEINNIEVSKYDEKTYSQLNSLSLVNENEKEITEKFTVKSGNQLYMVSVVDNGKKLVFFEDYRIVVDDITTSWNFTAPKGTNIKVQDIEVPYMENSDSNKTNSLGGFEVDYEPVTVEYKIGKIFNEDYRIMATLKGGQDIDIIKKAGEKVEIIFTATEEVSQNLLTKTKEFLDLYYSQASQEKYSELIVKDGKINEKTKTISSIKGTIQDYEGKITLDDSTHAQVSSTFKVKKEGKEVDYESLLNGGVRHSVIYFEMIDGTWYIKDRSYIF